MHDECAIWNDEAQSWEFGWIVHRLDRVNHTAIVSEEDSPAIKYVVDLDDIRH